MEKEFEKVISVGDYVIGVIWDEDENAYYIVDSEDGRLIGSNDYIEIMEKFQECVCEILNDYFADVYVEEVVS